MPLSVFHGRVVAAGEPLFLRTDTDAAMALAEEERDTCPACGYPKDWCRDPQHPFTDYEVKEETCQATYRLALRQQALEKEGAHEASMRSRQMAVVFRQGREPRVDAGLDLETADN